jgi:hypothetical protein
LCLWKKSWLSRAPRAANAAQGQYVQLQYEYQYVKRDRKLEYTLSCRSKNVSVRTLCHEVLNSVSAYTAISNLLCACSNEMTRTIVTKIGFFAAVTPQTGRTWLYVVIICSSFLNVDSLTPWSSCNAVIHAELLPHPCCFEPAKAVFQHPYVLEAQADLHVEYAVPSSACDCLQHGSGSMEFLGHPSLPAAAAQHTAYR